MICNSLTLTMGYTVRDPQIDQVQSLCDNVEDCLVFQLEMLGVRAMILVEPLDGLLF